MSESSRVIWHEGMPLKPHHFQQHDRYIHSIVTQRPNSYGMYAWGLTKIVIDESLLQHGKIAVKECSGCFPDGTIFNFPHEDFPPAPLEVDKTCKDTQVFLCIPMTQYGMPNTSISVDKVENTRYRGVSTTVVDQNIDNGTAEEIHVAKLNMKLMLEHEAREYYSCISILKIKEVSPDNAIILDQAFIPPCISVHGIQRLRGIMEEISGLTHNRGEVLSQQLNEIRKCGTSELTDYFILQFINAYDVQFEHFLNKKT